jgi:hypothetical protein
MFPITFGLERRKSGWDSFLMAAMCPPYLQALPGLWNLQFWKIHSFNSIAAYYVLAVMAKSNYDTNTALTYSQATC